MTIRTFCFSIFLANALALTSNSAHAFTDVCSRTPEVRAQIEAYFKVPCNLITAQHLAYMTRLEVVGSPSTPVRVALGDFDDLTGLKDLYLEVDIPTLEAGLFSDLRSLEIAILNNCNIQTIEPGAFSNSTQLEIIDLNGNSIRSFPKGLFTGLNSIELVSVRNNQFDQIPENFLSDSGITTKPEFALDLSGNPIQNVSRRAFKGANLSALALNPNNNVLTLEDYAFEGLSVGELALSGVEVLNELTLSGIISIRELIIDRSYNSFTKLKQIAPSAFQGLPQGLKLVNFSFEGSLHKELNKDQLAGLENSEVLEIVLDQADFNQNILDNLTGKPVSVNFKYKLPNTYPFWLLAGLLIQGRDCWAEGDHSQILCK